MSDRAHSNDAYHDGRDEAEAERLRPLEERLRDLSWPQPPPGARERTLAELHRKLADLNGSFTRRSSGAGGEDGAGAQEPEAARQREAS